MIEKEFIATIRQKRKEKGLTQVQLAELAGTYEHSISEYEKGLHSPNLWRAEDILSVLGMKLVIVPAED